MKRFLLVTLALAGTVGSARAADIAFAGPPGWDKASVAPSTDTARSVQQWQHSGDVQSLIVIRDTSTSYDDALAAIAKNLSSNQIKPATDADRACAGKTAHVIEFTTGPVTINRIVVPDGSGIVTITYTRPAGAKFDGDVKKSEEAYCTGS